MIKCINKCVSDLDECQQDGYVVPSGFVVKRTFIEIDGDCTRGWQNDPQARLGGMIPWGRQDHDGKTRGTSGEDQQSFWHASRATAAMETVSAVNSLTLRPNRGSDGPEMSMRDRRFMVDPARITRKHHRPTKPQRIKAKQLVQLLLDARQRQHPALTEIESQVVQELDKDRVIKCYAAKVLQRVQDKAQ